VILEADKQCAYHMICIMILVMLRVNMVQNVLCDQYVHNQGKGYEMVSEEHMVSLAPCKKTMRKIFMVFAAESSYVHTYPFCLVPLQLYSFVFKFHVKN